MKKDNFKKYEYFYTQDLPIPYKKLLIYPALVKNYFEFRLAMYCITIDKNKIPDAKVLSMSYLEFILYLINKRKTKEEKEIAVYLQNSFYQLIELCFKDVYSIKLLYDKKGKPYIRFELEDSLEENKKGNFIDITRKDFDEIKDIILFQNIPSYDNKYINPDLEEELNEINKIKTKNIEMPSFEMEKVTLSLNSNYTIQQIDELTLRKFRLMSGQSDDIINYKIYKQAEVSSIVPFKQEIGHYLYKKKTSNKDALVDYGQFKDKMSKVSK